MNCASGFAGYMGREHVPWAFISGFTTVAAGGIIAGLWMSRFVSQRSLKRAFSVFLILMGVFVSYRNRSAFVDLRPASGER